MLPVSMPAPSAAAYVADAMIGGYQTWISPYKGFRCAHRALHGRSSCSQYGRRAVMRKGVVLAVPLMQRRFARCREAADIIRTSGTLDYETPRQQQKRPPADSSGANCDVSPCDISDVPCDVVGDVACCVLDGDCSPF